MTTSNIIRSWNGRTIRQREDGYLNATDMCQSCDKRWDNWNRLDSTKEYLEVLLSKHYSDVSNGKLVYSQVGGTPETTGTWVYRKVALRLAQWLSPDFAVQVDEWIEELLLTGKVNLDSEKPLQLPPADIRVSNLINALQAIQFDLTNPRFNQELKDLAGDILGLTANTLTASKETWLGVAERAEQLGYSVSIVTQHRSMLGKFLKKFGLVSRMENRLCNGTQRSINLYLQTDAFDNAINEYFQKVDA